MIQIMCFIQKICIIIFELRLKNIPFHLKKTMICFSCFHFQNVWNNIDLILYFLIKLISDDLLHLNKIFNKLPGICHTCECNIFFPNNSRIKSDPYNTYEMMLQYSITSFGYLEHKSIIRSLSSDPLSIGIWCPVFLLFQGRI